eukprot:jgi/Mesen1/2418/ME000157S01557
MFSSMQEAHVKKEAALKISAELARRDALAAVEGLADSLVDSVNASVQSVFGAEKLIEVEVRSLGATVQRYRQQHAQWLAVLHDFDDALKELGDFENWVEIINHDLQTVAGAVAILSASAPASAGASAGR